MPDWKTDAELYEVAERLGNKVIEMYTNDGVWISAGTNRNTVMDGFRLDAEIFMSLDPQKIIDEFLRLRRASEDTGSNAEATSYLRTAGSHLTANWHGEAADRFAQQMSYVETFMEQQQGQLAFAAHSMGTVYSLAIHARRNYHNLAEATIARCDNEINGDDEKKTQANVGLLGEIAKACITGFSVPAKAGQLVTWALENFVSISAKGGEILLEGDESEKVTASYNRGIRELKASFEDGLNETRRWIDIQESELTKDKVPLLEPLPLHVDVHGADFSYGKFFHEDRGRDGFSPKVEQERKKAAELIGPAGPIGRRLAGAG